MKRPLSLAAIGVLAATALLAGCSGGSPEEWNGREDVAPSFEQLNTTLAAVGTDELSKTCSGLKTDNGTLAKLPDVPDTKQADVDALTKAVGEATTACEKAVQSGTADDLVAASTAIVKVKEAVAKVGATSPSAAPSESAPATSDAPAEGASEAPAEQPAETATS